MHKLPARLAPILLALILSGLMSLLVSSVATWQSLGLPDNFGSMYLASWLSSWLIAFPAVMVVAPVVRRLVVRCVRSQP